MATNKRPLDAAEWLEQMKAQPENVAALLAYESMVGHLTLDPLTGYVWQGNGTAFKLAPKEVE